MTSTQKKTWIGDLTALVTLSNILIKQVEAKKHTKCLRKIDSKPMVMNKKKLSWFFYCPKLKHSRCSQEDNEFSSDDHLKFFIVALLKNYWSNVLSRLTNKFLVGFDRYYQLWSFNLRVTKLKQFSAFILKRGLDLNLENLSELSCSRKKCIHNP